MAGCHRLDFRLSAGYGAGLSVRERHEGEEEIVELLLALIECGTYAGIDAVFDGVSKASPIQAMPGHAVGLQ